MTDPTIPPVSSEFDIMPDDSGDSVSDIALMVGIESMNAYDDKVKQYYKMVHEQNIILSNLNKAMEQAQLHTSGGGSDNFTFTYIDPTTGKPVQENFKQFLSDNNIPHPSDSDNYYNKTEWNTVLANIKSQSDSVSSTNQVDMMKLQSVLNKANQASTQASNIISKENTGAMSIINNFSR